MRILNLSHNKLTKLDSELFRGMRFLRRLYLNDNEISQVDRGTFSSMTRIGTIDLARNRMKIIDYQMFSGQNYVEVCKRICICINFTFKINISTHIITIVMYNLVDHRCV